MMELDARGISCPEPLVMLKKAVKAESAVKMLLDSKNAVENCEGFAKKSGFAVEITQNGDVYTLMMTKHDG